MSSIPPPYNSPSIPGLLPHNFHINYGERILLISFYRWENLMFRAMLLNRNIMLATCVIEKPLESTLEAIGTIKINYDNTFYLIQCIQNIITRM